MIPKISIVIPFYNASMYITRMLDSLAMQINKNFEVIFVDDGSNDNTIELIKNTKIPFEYHLVKQNNLGAPAARNNGLSQARGEYIYFCDVDDTLTPDCIEIFIQAIEEFQANIIVAHYLKVKPESSDLFEEKYVVKNRVTNLKDDKNFIFISPIPGNKIYKKEFLNTFNLKFDDVKIGQDLLFYLSALAVTDTIIYIDKIVYQYYINNNSISTTYDERILGILKTKQIILEYFSKLNLEDEFHNELQYLLNDHLLAQLLKLIYVSSKEKQTSMYNQLINDVNFKNIYQNPYYSKRYLYNLLWLIIKNRLIYFNPLIQFLLKHAIKYC